MAFTKLKYIRMYLNLFVLISLRKLICRNNFSFNSYGSCLYQHLQMHKFKL